MDVAIVTTRMIGMDAIGNFTMASAAALAKKGKVTVFTFAYERPETDGVEVRFLGGRNAHGIGTNLRALFGTFGLAHELSRYDVLILVNPDVGSMPACHLAKRYNPKLKVVWRFHGATPPEFLSTARDRLLMRMRNRAYAWSMKRSFRVITDSVYVKEDLERGGLDPAKVSAMKLGVDLAKFLSGDRQKIRSVYGIGERFLILYVGRLVNFKHVDELMDAVLHVDNACLLVAGSGPERSRLEARAKGEKRVLFAGRVPDGELPDYYAACDVWATASRHEGFCVPIIEAMAAGKPVLVPRVTAMPETAGDGGLAYQKGDVEGLARMLERVMGDKKLYGDLAMKATARASNFEMRHVLEEYVKEIEDIYRE